MCHAMTGSTRHHCKFLQDTNGIPCPETRNFSDLTLLFDISVSDEVEIFVSSYFVVQDDSTFNGTVSHNYTG